MSRDVGWVITGVWESARLRIVPLPMNFLCQFGQRYSLGEVIDMLMRIA